MSIRHFFLAINLIIVAFHGLLAYFDSQLNKRMVITLRGGAMTYMICMCIVVIRMGLLTIVFILVFLIGFALHILMFHSSLKMANNLPVYRILSSDQES